MRKPAAKNRLDRLQPVHKTTRNTDEFGIATVYLTDHEGTNKSQQGMLREGTLLQSAVKQSIMVIVTWLFIEVSASDRKSVV